MEIKYYRCPVCGNVIEVVNGDVSRVRCCGKELVELVANTVDAAVEKHVPVYEVEGNEIVVKVGEVVHPMEEKHYITFITLVTEDNKPLFEEAFKKHLNWSPLLCAPYTIPANAELVDRIAKDDMVRGVTIACGGFFGPQGRQLRVPLAFPKQNELIESFEFEGQRITNFEMESSALAGLAALMGHKAVTVCLVIANRLAKEANIDYDAKMKELIQTVLERI